MAKDGRMQVIVDCDLELGCTMPGSGQDLAVAHPRSAEWAALDSDHLMRPMSPQAEAAVRCDRVPNSPPPPEPVGSQRLHLDRPINPGEPVQLLSYHRGLECSLRLKRYMLEVAAAATARVGVPTWSRDAVDRGRSNRDRVASAERAAAIFGDLDEHLLTRQSVPDEDDPTGEARDAVAAVCDRSDRDLESSTEPGRRLRGEFILAHVRPP
jgi:hypothetical protein